MNNTAPRKRGARLIEFLARNPWAMNGRQTGFGQLRYRTQESAAGAPATVSDDMESRLLTLSELEGGALVEVTSGNRSPE